ncbi:unnamed protein product [Diamesa hyperborea]
MEKQLCKEISDFKEEIVKQMQLTESITTEEKGNKKSYFENEHGKLQKELKDTENDAENGTDGENNNEAMADVEENLDATEIDKTEGQQHLTRSRTNQITNGTYFFKLGMENSFKSYSNQFTFNPVALNKPQKNEERDKKRHLSHKFSLTQASEFKWGGLLNGTQSSLIAVFKQTLLTFESAISSPYMHCNWTKLRKLWLNAVAASTTPQDFAKLLIVLETSFKSVTFANVWHEHLGHTKLYRITSGEREERKKSEKREKREGDEEERHRLAYNFVKYSLGLKHQVWKQKGEEYRIHGQWGWLWSSRSRRNKIWNNIYRQRIQYVNVVITHETKDKVISLKRQTFENLNKILELNNNQGMDDEADEPNCAILRGIEVVKDQKERFESIDVSQALNAKTRVIFPKVAKKSTLDDLLERREKLRDVELKIKETDNNGEIPENIIQTAESHKKKFVGSTQCIQKILQDIIDSKTKTNQKTKHSEVSEKCQQIHNLRTEMQYVTDILKKHKCYSRNCRNGTTPINLQSFSLCYSNLCLKETQIKKKIALLIQQLKERYSIMGKKQSILHQKLTEAKNNDLLDILHKYQLWDYMNDEYFQYDLTTCVEDLSAALTEAIDYDSKFIIPFAIKSEIETKMEIEETNEPKVKKEEEEDDDEDEDEEMKEDKPEYVNRPNRRFTNIVRPKKEIEIEKELDADGNEKVYATTSPQGKIYLKKLEKVVKDATVVQPNGTATTSTSTTTTVSTTLKYPAITTFSTVKQTKNILILPKYELIRVARRSGRIYVDGFNHNAKNNTSVWPYPCSRPLFKTCWTYRSFCVTSFASLALQLRIIWTCMRWDDMATKPSTTDGKNQITSESEILTTELLKHRNVGSFMEKTQYFRRKIVIPLELPKTIREVQSIRSGLRKRKRAESPQQTEPQVTEEWVDEDKLELWEIKQYGEKLDKINFLPTTRTSTGKLPLPRQYEVLDNKGIVVSSKATPEQIKERMEQQLRLQRAAHNQKRADEQKNQGITGYKTVTRKIMVKNPDGTTRIIHQNVQQPIVSVPTPQVVPKPAEQQKVQILRGADGKLSVRGLQPHQQLIQTADGKLHVVTNQAAAPAAQANKVVQVPRIIKAQPSTVGNQIIQTTVSSNVLPATKSQIVIRPVQKTYVAANTQLKVGEPKILNSEYKPETLNSTTSIQSTSTGNQGQIQKIITSSGQLITQQVQSNNVITTTNLQQLLQRGQVTGQKIIVQNQPTIQKLLVASPQQQQGEKRIIIQNQQPQQIMINQNNSQQFIVSGGQKILLSPDQRIVTQTVSSPQQTAQIQQIKTIQSPIQQQIQFQIQEQPKPQQQLQQQQQQTQQIVVQANGNNIAQQLAQGKIQIASFNGQQVLLKTLPNGQSQIVGHIKSSQQVTPTGTTVIKQQMQPQQVQVQAVPQQQQQIQVQQQQQHQVQQQQQQQQQIQPQQIIKTVQMQQQPSIVSTGDQVSEQQLLQGHPPGTVIKCVTAQVVQTNNGPRIVLQGLQGTDFTQQQTQFVQQQVKQQLLKAQESSGLKGVSLGPTKIYLAIQPSQSQQQSQPPPLTPVLHNQFDDDLIAYETGDADAADASELGNEINDENNSEGFVVTQEYIQDTIKNVLKQGNLNPEIEEKLLTLQRYQEKQAKGEPFDTTSFSSSYTARGAGGSGENDRGCQSPVDDDFDEDSMDSETRPSRRRGAGAEDDDDEWVLDTPRKYVKKADRDRSEGKKGKDKDYMGEFKKTIAQDKLDAMTSGSLGKVQLHKHKESLKKMILKKRDLLEKELQNEIEMELSVELASHIKNVCAKQEVVVKKEQSKYMRKKMEAQLAAQQAKQLESPEPIELPNMDKASTAPRPKKTLKSNTAMSSEIKKKKQKLYCLCRKPYDKSKFYIGCDLCNNWYHGDCVGISEESSKEMTDFVCDECERAKDTQELFCLCRTPYDQALFYICCDKCQDWFHGKCVGILQSEAEFIDEYICPNCQKNNSINFANLKPLTHDEFEELHSFLKDILTNKNAWPFIDPVDANEVPDYYNVIKEPMDLKQIEQKVLNQEYNCFADFIKDMTKIFDNCRYYNAKDSTFCKCAESLETYFLGKIRTFREILMKPDNE